MTNPIPATGRQGKATPPKPRVTHGKEEKTEPKDTPKPVETKPVETKADDFDWDTLAPPIEAPKNVAAGITIDIKKEIPESVRKRVEEALVKFEENTKTFLADPKLSFDKKGEKKTPPSVYLLQPCGSKEMAEKFVAMVKRYGKWRDEGQLTVRANVLPKDPTVVRFGARPLQTRKRQEDKKAS